MTQRQAGFTLLELLCVIVVAGMIIVMLGQGLRIGLHGTNSYFQAIRGQSDMQPVDHALRAMIEHMDPGIYPETPFVLGTADAFAFTTDLPNPANGGTMAADVRLEAHDGALLLLWTPHTRGVPFAAPPPPQRKVLLEGIQHLQISYAAKETPSTWVASWRQPMLPGLVRLRLMSANGVEAWPPIIARPPREQAEQ